MTVTRSNRACVAAMMCAGVVTSGCGGPAGPDPKAEAQQKIQADAMMKQYETGGKAAGDAQPDSK